MKAKRLLLCILLSVALTVTFIPVMSYAAYDDPHEVVFIGSETVYDAETEFWYADYDHGELYGTFDDEQEMFVSYEGNYVSFNIRPDSGWEVSEVTYSLNGEEYDSVSTNEYGDYEFRLPVYGEEIDFDYNEVLVSVKFESMKENYGTIVINDWERDPDNDVHWRGPFDSEAEFSEASFCSFEDDSYTHAQIGDTVFLDVYPGEEEGKVIDELTLNGNPIIADEESGSYSFVVSEDIIDGDEWTAGNIIDISFKEPDPENVFPDLTPELKENAEEIYLDDEIDDVGNDCLFKFVPEEDGVYVFYSYQSGSSVDPVGRVVDDKGMIIEEDDTTDDNHFQIIFNAEAGKAYYLQAMNYSGETLFGVGLAESDVVGVTFTPKGQHLAIMWCDEQEYGWYLEYAAGDTITLNYSGGDKEVYTFEEDEYYRFVNADGDKLNVAPYFDADLPTSVYKSGNTATISTNLVYAGLTAKASINVKFEMLHPEDGLKKISAASATCTAAGRSQYWQCDSCKKFFKDQNGVYEIAKNSWVIPAKGHKWAWKTDAMSGLLKNGKKHQECSICHATQNLKTVVPGYANYYVKGLKVKKGKKSFTVKWKKQSKKNLKLFNGYQIRYSTAANMSGAKFATAGKKAKSKKIKGLQKKTTYYVQVRTFTKTGAGTFYSKWSPTKKVKTK